VEDQVGAVVEGAQQVGRGEGRVDHQRQVVLVGQRGHARDVEHVQARIAQRFAEQHLGLGADRGAPGVEVARVDEGGLDAEALQGIGQQVVRAAVQGARGHDVRAGAGDGGQAQVHRGLAAGGGDAGHAALERGDAFFEHGVGRVRDARIDVAARSMLNSEAAWSESRKANEDVKWIGVARAPVAGSGAAPACSDRVSKPG
jgi:hypothetical protein